MEEDVDAGPDLEEEWGCLIIGEIRFPNGQVDVLVVSIDAGTGTQEA